MWHSRATLGPISLENLAEDKVSLLMVKTPAVGRSPSVHSGPSFRIHAFASGKLPLAYQPDAVVDSVLSKGLDRFTDRTITDPELLRTQLQAIRERGYAVSIGESDPSLWGIAFPINSGQSQVNYAVGLITFGGSIRDDEAYMAEVSPVLRETADIRLRFCNSRIQRTADRNPVLS